MLYFFTPFGCFHKKQNMAGWHSSVRYMEAQIPYVPFHLKKNITTFNMHTSQMSSQVDVPQVTL